MLDISFSRIDKAELSERHIQEGCEQPTKECRNLSKVVVDKIYETFNMQPKRIAATVENGICLYYNEKIDDFYKETAIEVYNDLDVAGITYNRELNKIYKCIDIENLDFSELFL